MNTQDLLLDSEFAVQGFEKTRLKVSLIWLLKINACFSTLIAVSQIPLCKVDPHSFAGYIKNMSH